MRVAALSALLLALGALPAAAQAPPAAVVSYDAGHSAATQFIAQDASFRFDRFREGFEAGFRGDSSQIAFAIGLRIGLAMATEPAGAADPEAFLRGMREGLDGTASPYSDRDIDLANRAVQDTVMMGRLRDAAATNPAAQERLTLIQTNARTSAAFLDEVATRPGVQRTESGVLYAITTPGAGARPGPADQVLVHYVGRFADGVEFDRSPEGQAVIFRVGGVVPGFAEMLLAMQPGESRTVYLPPNQAFGITGSTGPEGESGVPPASALVFDLSLVEVVAPGDVAE